RKGGPGITRSDLLVINKIRPRSEPARSRQPAAASGRGEWKPCARSATARHLVCQIAGVELYVLVTGHWFSPIDDAAPGQRPAVTEQLSRMDRAACGAVVVHVV